MTRRNRWTNLVPAQVREPITARVTNGAPELLVYDVIDAWGGDWGVSAQDVAAALAQVGDVPALTVRINSPGGDYFEGVAIAGMLARHTAEVTVCVDGLAASAASVVAMGGDRIVMGAGSQLMIHEASTATWGTADELRRQAAMLDQTNDDIAALYAARAGDDPAAWREAVRVETWYTAAQAVAAGLADEVASLPPRSVPESVAARTPHSPSVALPTAEPVEPAPASPAPLPTLSELVSSALTREAVA